MAGRENIASPLAKDAKIIQNFPPNFLHFSKRKSVLIIRLLNFFDQIKLSQRMKNTLVIDAGAIIHTSEATVKDIYILGETLFLWA